MNYIMCDMCNNEVQICNIKEPIKGIFTCCKSGEINNIALDF
jgi:hypothetical protein